MALWPIATKQNCVSYTPWDGVTIYSYNQNLITPPRHYTDSLWTVSHWFYDPGSDRLVLVGMLAICQWPGWSVKRYDYNADTGEQIGSAELSIYSKSWVGRASLGSFSSIYATWNSGTQISEIDASTVWPQTGMWSIDPHAWTPSRNFSHAVVNREDGLIVGISASSMEIWDITGVPFLKGTIQLPYTLGYLTYESREICWIITSNGLVGKANYRLNPPRWEMLSSVQNPTEDAMGYFVAFDPKRKRLAVFRLRPDADDGSCQSQIEFYRPLYRVSGLTEPVPVSRLRTGERTRFVSHLYGENGEGVSTYLVHGDLAPPAAGAMLTPISGAELSGAVTFRYQAPPMAATDTMMVSATVTDGD
jgi:hypothetical protein